MMMKKRNRKCLSMVLAIALVLTGFQGVSARAGELPETVNAQRESLNQKIDINDFVQSVTLKEFEKVYDGTEKKPEIETISIDSEKVCVESMPSDWYTVSYCNNINAGTAEIRISGKEGSGYTGAYTETFSIEQRSLSLGQIPNIEKTYDGNENVTMTCPPGSVLGVVETDANEIGIRVSGSFKDKNAGDEKTVNLNQIEITGASAANYKLNVEMPITATGKISPRQIEISWQGPFSFTYDGKEHKITADINNRVEGDTVGLGYKGNVEKEAGDYEAKVETLTGEDAKNYTLDDTAGRTQAWKIVKGTSPEQSAPPASPSKVPPASPSKVPPASPSKVPPASPSKAPETAPPASPSKAPETAPPASPSKAPETAPPVTPSEMPQETAEPTGVPEPEKPDQTVLPAQTPVAADMTAMQITQSPGKKDTEYFVAVGKEVRLQIAVQNVDETKVEYRWYCDGKRVEGNLDTLTVKMGKKGTVLYTCDIYNSVSKETKKAAGSWKVTGYSEKVSITYKKSIKIKDIFGKELSLRKIQVSKKGKKALAVNVKKGTITMKKHCKNVEVTMTTKDTQKVSIFVSTVYPKPVIKAKKGGLKTYIEGNYRTFVVAVSNVKDDGKVIYEYSKQKKKGYKASSKKKFIIKQGSAYYIRVYVQYRKHKSPYSKPIKIKG